MDKVEEQQLRTRLSKISDSPDFTSFFAKFATRPPIRIKKGDTIFYEGDQPDRLYFIKSGYVKMSHLSEEGKDTIIYLYGPGHVMGIRALTSSDQCLKHNAYALTDVEIITLSRKDYLDIVCQYPEFLVDLLHIFIERLNYAENKLEGFILADANARVANFLANCAQRFGQKRDGKTTIPIPFTHQLISEFVGSLRETVTLAINRLKKEGIIQFEKGQITILDHEKLNHYALIHEIQKRNL